MARKTIKEMRQTCEWMYARAIENATKCRAEAATFPKGSTRNRQAREMCELYLDNASAYREMGYVLGLCGHETHEQHSARMDILTGLAHVCAEEDNTQ